MMSNIRIGGQEQFARLLVHGVSHMAHQNKAKRDETSDRTDVQQAAGRQARPSVRRFGLRRTIRQLTAGTIHQIGFEGHTGKAAERSCRSDAARTHGHREEGISGPFYLVRFRHFGAPFLGSDLPTHFPPEELTFAVVDDGRREKLRAGTGSEEQPFCCACPCSRDATVKQMRADCWNSGPGTPCRTGDAIISALAARL